MESCRKSRNHKKTKSRICRKQQIEQIANRENRDYRKQ